MSFEGPDFLVRTLEHFGAQPIEVNQHLDGELGKTVWDTSLVLLGMLETDEDLSPLSGYWADKAVLDLSGGTGALGIAVARLGCARVVITDLAACTPLIRHNVKRNGVERRVEVHEFAWGDDPRPLEPRFDVVFMSDLVTKAYEEHFPALIRSLDQLLADGGVAYLGYELRDATPFFDLLYDAGFLFDRVSNAKLDDVFVSDDIRVFKVTRKEGT